MGLNQLRPLIILAWSLAVGAALLTDLGNPVRAPLMISYLTLAPGLATIRFLGLRNRFYEIGFAITLSLALSALVASVLLYLSLWSSVLAITVLALLTTLFAVRDPDLRHSAVPVEALHFSRDDAAQPMDGEPPPFSRPTPSHQAVPAEMAAGMIPKARIFASRGERRFRAGLVLFARHEFSQAAIAFEEAIDRDPQHASGMLMLGLTYDRLGRSRDAAALLAHVVASETSLPDAWMNRYLPGGATIAIAVTNDVSVDLDLNLLSAALVLARLYRDTGRERDATTVIQRLHLDDPANPIVRLAFAESSYEADDFDVIFALADGVKNTDDYSLALLHLQAKALANRGLIGPAAELLTVLLRRRAGRNPHLLRAIRYNRAEAFELLGNDSKARADWEKLCADDPRFRDVRARLERSLAVGTPIPHRAPNRQR